VTITLRIALWKKPGSLHRVTAENELYVSPDKAPCPILAVILSERSESKDLRLPLRLLLTHKSPVPHPFRALCEMGGKPQNKITTAR